MLSQEDGRSWLRSMQENMKPDTSKDVTQVLKPVNHAGQAYLSRRAASKLALMSLGSGLSATRKSYSVSASSGDL